GLKKGGVLEKEFGVAQETLSGEPYALHESALELESIAVGDRIQPPEPLPLVVPQQYLFTTLRLATFRVVVVELDELTLQADEFAARVAALLQPVGVNQARRVIIRRFEDGLQKSVVLGHWSSRLPCGPETSAPLGPAHGAIAPLVGREAVLAPARRPPAAPSVRRHGAS